MRKTPAMRALLYSGDLLSVDLGTFAIKVMHVRAKERSLVVLGTAQREVWRSLSEAKTDEEKNGIYARTLREILSERGFRVRNASISLAGNMVIVRFMSVPPGFLIDWEKGLPAEARALIPFGEPDPVVSAMLVDGHQPPQKELLLSVAEKKTVQGGMDVARKAGLRPAVIINDVLAFANAHGFFGAKAETVVLVNAGATSTSVIVLENGVPKAARVFNIAGNTLTRAVKREFSMELEEAEKLKIAYGLSSQEPRTSEQDAIAARVARTLKPAVKDLCAEIHRTIDVFLERRPADYPAITRIALAGGTANMKGLAEYISAETGIAAEVFKPMVNVTGKDGAPAIVPLAPELAVACGLGLSNTLLRRSQGSRINLVPKKARRAAIIRDVSPRFWWLLLVPVALVAALQIYSVLEDRLSHREATSAQRLAAAAKVGRALRTRFAKKSVVAAPREDNSFAFLNRLSVSGVLRDGSTWVVMLSGGGTVYVARGGKLLDANESEVPGVRAEINDTQLVLSVRGKRYSILLPK